eukprot:gene6682-6905_t
MRGSSEEPAWGNPQYYGIGFIVSYTAAAAAVLRHIATVARVDVGNYTLLPTDLQALPQQLQELHLGQRAAHAKDFSRGKLQLMHLQDLIKLQLYSSQYCLPLAPEDTLPAGLLAVIGATVKHSLEPILKLQHLQCLHVQQPRSSAEFTLAQSDLFPQSPSSSGSEMESPVEGVWWRGRTTG